MPRTDSDHGRFGGSKIQNEPQPAKSGSSHAPPNGQERTVGITKLLFERTLHYHRYGHLGVATA